MIASDYFLALNSSKKTKNIWKMKTKNKYASDNHFQNITPVQGLTFYKNNSSFKCIHFKTSLLITLKPNNYSNF